MFGFLRGSKCDRVYRQAYAHCCQIQHRELGFSSLAFLSYEGVFAYLLSMDAGWTPIPAADSPTCCRLRRASPQQTANDPAARFAAAVGITLAAVKLEDDLRDSCSWVAWLALLWYRRNIRRARALLDGWQPGINAKLSAAIDDHLRLERSAGPIAISEYVEPTARAFGELFGVLPAACQRSNEHVTRAFASIAADVGRAIIAFDCAVDWRWDRVRGEFNPLADEEEVQAARGFAVTCLRRARANCRSEFGEQSHASRLLEFVIRRLLSVPAVRDWPSCERTQERWGLLREPGFTYAKCDGGCDCGSCGGCDACAACGGCEACGAAGDAGANCDPACANVCASGWSPNSCAVGGEVVPAREVVPPVPAADRAPLPCGCFDCFLCCECGQSCAGGTPPPLTKSRKPKVRPEDERVC